MSGIHLLCIGISRYAHAPLTSGATSALRVYQTFVRLSAAEGLRLPLRSAELVVDPDPIETELIARLAPDEAALFARATRPVTRTELDRVFNAWFNAVRAAPDDIAVLYFAGHGLGLDEQVGSESKTLLLASDFDEEFRRPPRAVTLEHLLSGLQPANHADAVARRQLYLLDCCRTRGWDGPPAEQGDLEIAIANRRMVDPSVPDDRHVAVQYACRAGDQAYTDDNELDKNALATTHFADALIATLDRLQDLPELRVEYLLKHVSATLEQRHPAQQVRRGRFNDFPLRVYDAERAVKPIAVIQRHSEAEGAAATVLAEHAGSRRQEGAPDRPLAAGANELERASVPAVPSVAVSTSQSPPATKNWWKRAVLPIGLVALGGSALIAVAGARASGPPAPPPAGMIALPGASYEPGTSPADAESAYRDCLEYARVHGWLGRKELPCSVPFPQSWFARETRIYGAKMTLRPFFIDRTEVTNQAFSAWLNENKQRFVLIDDGEGHTPRVAFDHGPPFVSVITDSKRPSGVKLELRAGIYRSDERDAERPVVGVTWLGADAYCKAQGKRLPTELEWEYAARGSAHRRAPWGDGAPTCGRVAIGQLSWQECASAVTEPALAGSSDQDRTPEGVSDLGGNVSEWTSDAYSSGPQELPCDAASGHSCRTLRGASFEDAGLLARSAFRARFDESKNATTIGFRCAKDAP